ncbi:DUF4405 domain-containing protein [Adlercreutzia sp. ZJ473]|uniref:DUF4405 domain-containing protein n=1 Tax=Adlercreutzia sp. ZJ473 TaxID=2722822 RepID=UPI001556A40E|nr:DUF4405 domain-containing protein [Adlercreutzia sp. ZJ473]
MMRGSLRVFSSAALLVFYAVISFPGVTGVALHEWAALVLTIALLMHAALRADRIMSARAGSLCARWAGRAVLDVLLLVALAACTVSGVMMSGAVLPAFGLYATGYYFWNPLHAVAAKALLALLLMHLALVADSALRCVRRSVTDGGEGW